MTLGLTGNAIVLMAASLLTTSGGGFGPVVLWRGSLGSYAHKPVAAIWLVIVVGIAPQTIPPVKTITEKSTVASFIFDLQENNIKTQLSQIFKVGKAPQLNDKEASPFFINGTIYTQSTEKSTKFSFNLLYAFSSKKSHLPQPCHSSNDY
jgi:hypothetical protein